MPASWIPCFVSLTANKAGRLVALPTGRSVPCAKFALAGAPCQISQVNRAGRAAKSRFLRGNNAQYRENKTPGIKNAFLSAAICFTFFSRLCMSFTSQDGHRTVNKSLFSRMA